MFAEINRSDFNFTYLEEKETDGGEVAQLLWQFRAGENSGGFYKLCEDEKSELPPKDIAKIA